jgi:flavin reductase (DIM6/NTAB) family NADH-FMN oxidoreductase RutF
VSIEEYNPEIVFVLKKDSYIGKLIVKEFFFTVSVLSIDQPSFARKYGSNRDPDLISDNNWSISNQFSHLNGARIFLDCRLVKIYDSHRADIYVGSVVEYAASKNQKSLIYDERTYGKFESI